MSEFLRTSTNLVVFAILTVVLLVYFAFTIAADIFLDDRYPVTLVLPDSGGLVENHFVTVLGTHVGRVHEMRIVDDGVEFELRIHSDSRVPQYALVHVLRSSAIGEHTINLVPVDADWEPQGNGRVIPRFERPVEGWQPLEPGESIQARHIDMPTPTRELLANMEGLFAAIPKEELSTVVHELADAFGGRGEVLVDLNRQTHALYQTLVPAIPEFERQLHTARPMLEALSDSRDDIAAMIGHVADLSELLADARPVTERLIDSSYLATSELDALIRPNQANINCLIRDVRDYQQVNVDNLGWLQQSIDLNTYFWDGNRFSRQLDPWRPGLAWLRSGTIAMGPSTAAPYDEPRPTPETRPGAACESEFGVGVNAIRQADHQPAHPTAPDINWAPMVEGAQHEQDPEARPAPDRGDSDEQPTAAPAWPREETPRTGGGAGLLGLALISAAVALRLRTAGARAGRR
jgi:ABC-type transporter Mla subunit MlaD